MNLQACGKKREVKRVNGSKVTQVLAFSDIETDLQRNGAWSCAWPHGRALGRMVVRLAAWSCDFEKIIALACALPVPPTS